MPDIGLNKIVMIQEWAEPDEAGNVYPAPPVTDPAGQAPRQ